MGCNIIEVVMQKFWLGILNKFKVSLVINF